MPSTSERSKHTAATTLGPATNVFTTTQTFRRSRPNNTRSDIDMKLQREAIALHRAQSNYDRHMKDFEATCGDPWTHVIFIRMLLGEAERFSRRQQNSTGKKSRRDVRDLVAIRRRRRLLKRLADETYQTLKHNQGAYTECLAYVGAAELWRAVPHGRSA